MIKDFSKIETFLTVVREKSFSKASKKLGISQPAVTQQIKLIEEYLDVQIVDRKKNGIKLTTAGEEIYKLSLKLEKFITSAEREMLRLVNKKTTFIMGASPTIGHFVLPNFLNEMKSGINNDIMLKIDNSEAITELLLDKKIDLALVDTPTLQEGVVYREWLEDELVIVSRTPLPKLIGKEELSSYDWICREDGSHTRKIIHEAFEKINADCTNFKMRSIITSSTVAKNTLLKSNIDEKIPTVSILSRHAVSEELEQGILFTTKIKGLKLSRKFYLAYIKDRKQDSFIAHVISYIMSKRKV